MKNIYRSNNIKNYPVRVTVLSVIFAAFLFLILPLSQMFYDTYEKKIIIRPIDLASEPPPPPPDQQKNENVVEEEVVNIQSTDTVIELTPLDVVLNPTLNDALVANVGVNAREFQNINIQEDFELFSLPELDESPRSLNDPLMRIPRSLANEEINAVVLIILTEKGDVEFQGFISISHDEAAEAVRDYVRKLKFTPPTKNGEVGRVQFTLPVRSRVL